MYPESGFFEWFFVVLLQAIFMGDFFRAWPPFLLPPTRNAMVLFIPLILYLAVSLIFRFQKVRCNTFLILRFPNDPRVPLVLFNIMQKLGFLLALILFIAESVELRIIIRWGATFYTSFYLAYLSFIVIVVSIRSLRSTTVDFRDADVASDTGTTDDVSENEIRARSNEFRVYANLTDEQRDAKMHRQNFITMYQRIPFNVTFHSVLYQTESTPPTVEDLEQLGEHVIENRTDVFTKFSLSWALYDPLKVRPPLYWLAWFHTHIRAVTTIAQLWFLYARMHRANNDKDAVSYLITLAPVLFYLLFDILVVYTDMIRRPFKCDKHKQTLAYYPASVFRAAWALTQTVFLTATVTLATALDRFHWDGKDVPVLDTPRWKAVFSLYLAGAAVPVLYTFWLLTYFWKVRSHQMRQIDPTAKRV